MSGHFQAAIATPPAPARRSSGPACRRCGRPLAIDSFLLGCGCPLGPAIGLVDAMRIGPDTGPNWDRQFRGIRLLFSKEQSIPAGINSVQGALGRAALHRRWWLNDPDCLLLRPDTALSLAEVRTLATVNALTGGLLLVSDDLPALPADRRRLLGTLLPPIGQTPHVLDWFENAPPALLQLDLQGPAGRWHLLAVCNWAEKTRDLAFRLQDTFLDSAGDLSGPLVLDRGDLSAQSGRR